MISVRRQHVHSAFGPQSSPLYYTALSRAPRRLIVAGLKGECLCNIVLTVVGTDARMQWILPSRPVNGICVWPLTTLMAQADASCAWHIEETEQSPADGHGEERAVPSIPPREGRFRLLDAICSERLLQGRQRLQRVGDGNVGSIAGALFMAELGLYHEALALMGAYLKNEPKRRDQLLARTVQTLIYKQMLRQIEQERLGQPAGDPRLGLYLTWTQNRERYHREMTIAMMRGRCPSRCLHEIASP